MYSKEVFFLETLVIVFHISITLALNILSNTIIIVLCSFVPFIFFKVKIIYIIFCDLIGL